MRPKGNTNYMIKNFSKLKWLIAFLNKQTELSSTIHSGKQFKTSMTRQEKDDLRELINDKVLNSFKLTLKSYETTTT